MNNSSNVTNLSRIYPLEKYSPYELLKMYRHRAGLLQKELAGLLGLQSSRMVYKWESEESLPKVEHLKKLIEIYLYRSVFMQGQEKEEARQLWAAIKGMYDTATTRLALYPVFDAGWFEQIYRYWQDQPVRLVSKTELSTVVKPGETLVPKDRADYNTAAQTNLPVQWPTRLVGRHTELEKLVWLLKPANPPAASANLLANTESRSRLVTLVGPGGVGKTRLAIEVGRQLQPRFKDGVFLVELAQVREPELVITTICQTLGVKELASQPLLQTLQNYLATRQMLIVLDNFEQVVSAAPVLNDLMLACASLKLLVTSREALKLYGEQIFELKPLPLPREGEDLPAPSLREVITGVEPNQSGQRSEVESNRLATLSSNAAVRLFVERVQLVQPEFELTLHNAPVVVQICRKLEGLPLALELAASGMRLYSLEELWQGLNRRWEVLKLGEKTINRQTRQQTVAKTLEWSYGLLTQEEQRVFRALGLFVGGFTPVALATVVGLSEEEGLELLSSLVDKSLVVRKWQIQEKGGLDFSYNDQDNNARLAISRFGMLESVREYALQKLMMLAREYEQVYNSYSHYYLKLAKETAAGLSGNQQGWRLSYLQSEYPNLRAVLGWSVSGPTGVAEPGQTENPTNPNEGLMKLEVGLELVESLRLFWLRRTYGKEARMQIELIVSKCEQYPLLLESEPYARALATLARINISQGDYYLAKWYAQQSFEVFERKSHQEGIAYSLSILTLVAYEQSLYVEAQALGEAALKIYRELNDLSGIARCLSALGVVAYYQADYEKAQKLHEEALSLQQFFEDTNTTAGILVNLSAEKAEQRNYEQAEKLLKQALVICEQGGDEIGLAYCLNDLACLYLDEGRNNHQEIRDLLQKSQVIYQKSGVMSGLSNTINNQGLEAYREQDYQQAQALFLQSLQIRIQLRSPWFIAYSLAGFVMVWSAVGRFQQAAELAGVLEKVLAQLNTRLQSFYEVEYKLSLAGLKNKLSAAEFAASYAKGQDFASLEEALASFDFDVDLSLPKD